MTKILRVIVPFFVVEEGDTFEWNNNTKMYVVEHNEEFHKSDDNSTELKSEYKSNFAISEGYAKELVEDGYLEEVTPENKNKTFVNVFDEIQRLINKYTEELNNLCKDMANMPECMKVERATVLNNILSVLNHLSELKK